MASHDLKRDIEQVRDEIKDLFFNLQQRHPDVKFAGSVNGNYIASDDGDVAIFDVVVTTTHSDN